MPCVARVDRDDAFRAAKRAVADMLPAYVALAQKLPDAKAALMTGSGITEDDFAAAVMRLRAGEVPEAVLDQRFVTAFTIAGNADDCCAQAATYAAAGVTELALTFSDPSAHADMNYIARRSRDHDAENESHLQFLKFCHFNSPLPSARAPQQRIVQPLRACRQQVPNRQNGIFQ